MPLLCRAGVRRKNSPQMWGGVSASESQLLGSCHCQDNISTPNPPCKQWIAAVKVGAGRWQPLVENRGGFHSVGWELVVSGGQ